MATSGKIRAKFICSTVEQRGNTFSVYLSPVVGGSEENNSFYKATPGGAIALEVVSEDTADNFEQGQEYYVDFSKAKS
jgi:hypothetical protein